MRKIKLAAAMTVLMAFGMGSGLRADVLESVPADTFVALKVANLTQTSGKVAKLAKAFGIDAFVPKLQNPLGSLKESMHVEKGLNENGEMAVAFVSPKVVGVPADKSMLILLPVSSYADFLSNFADAKTENGITETTIDPNEKQPMYIADWNGYAAVSPAKEVIAKPAATMKIAGLAAKEAARQDFLVYTNFQKLSPELLPDLDKGMNKAMAEIDRKANADIDPKYKPLIKVALTQLFGCAKTFLDNTDSATVGLNIDDAGLNATVLSEFKPDSYLGKVSASLKNTEGPLTNGLPATKYFAFGGAAYDTAPVLKVVDDLLQPVLPELNKVFDPATVTKLHDAIRASTAATKGVAIGMPAPQKVGQEAMIQQFAIYRGSGNETKTVMDQMTDLVVPALNGMKMPEGKPTMTADKKVADKNIEGIQLDSFTFAIKPAPEDPAAAQMQQMSNIMYGGEGPVYHYGVLGSDMVLATSMPDATTATFIKAAKANDDSVGKLDQVKVVAAELPKARLFEYYVSIDEMVNTGVATAGQFGFPLQVQLPPELPPFGFTLGTEGTAMRIDAHIPSTTVQSLIAAGMQVFMQFNGGGGNL